MYGSRTASRTETTQAARYVSSRVFGDLRSLYENFGLGTLHEWSALAHDVQLGLAHDCLGELRLFLFPPGADQHTRVYIYKRVATGTFEASSNSGRIGRTREFQGGSIAYEVAISNSTTWADLEREDKFRIPWKPCIGRPIVGMTAQSDGGYEKGEIGLSRTMYTMTGS